MRPKSSLATWIFEATRSWSRASALAFLCGCALAASPVLAYDSTDIPDSVIIIRADLDESMPVPGDSVAVITAEAKPKHHGLLHDLGSAGVAFASDFWYVASCPLRINRTGLIWTTGVVAASAVVYQYDREILDAVVRNRDAPVLGQVLRVGTNLEPMGMMGRTNPYYAGALGIGYTFQIHPLVQIPAELIESHYIAGGLRNMVKFVVGRRHPFEDPSPRVFDPMKMNGGTSFPSGHTSVVYEVATITSMHAHSTPVTVVAYGLATTVAIQRIGSRSHWPSDVLIPAVTGSWIARTVVRRHEERSFSYVPFYETRDGVPTVGFATRL